MTTPANKLLTEEILLRRIEELEEELKEKKKPNTEQLLNNTFVERNPMEDFRSSMQENNNVLVSTEPSLQCKRFTTNDGVATVIGGFLFYDLIYIIELDTIV